MRPVEPSRDAVTRLIPAHRDPAEYLQYLAQLEEYRLQSAGQGESAPSPSRVLGRAGTGGLWKVLGLALAAAVLAGAAISLVDLSSRPGDLEPSGSALDRADPILTPYAPVIISRETSAPTSPNPQSHVVDRGETLTSIAGRYGVSVEAIAVLNGLEDTDAIFAGQRLTIPAATGRTE